MFQKYLDKKQISDNLKDFSLYHSISDRSYWESVKDSYYSELKSAAAYYDRYTFEPLYASLYREYVTKKDRANFESKYFERRNALIIYTLLEAIENEGKYIEKAADLTWMILEETEWAVPAHIHLIKASDSLPYYKNPCLDLFASETASTLSFVYTVLKEKFDALSRNIALRTEEEINERIIENYLKHDDYWWMGLTGIIPNNWNPWVNSNVLAVTFTMPVKKEVRTEVLYKAMLTLDKYLDNCPDDGACDEGPTYWQRAGESALECFDIICRATGGKINMFGEDKVKNILEYILKAYIYNNRVANFADAQSLLKLEQGTLMHFGKLMKNEKIISLAKQSFDTKPEPLQIDGRSFIIMRRTLYYMENYNELKNSALEFSGIKETFLKSISFFAMRENEHGTKGLYIAAKGGHNAESHNHNDVGNFMIFKDGEPFLVDSGNMTYSALTFDDKTRYTLWTNMSEYHNLPKINGKNQHENREYCADNVKYLSDSEKTVFSLDIKNAYENKAEINKWVRTFTFDKKNPKISVAEDYSLKNAREIVLNFLSLYPACTADGGLLIKSDSGAELHILTNTEKFDFTLEEIALTDKLLENSWGDKLYRIRLTLKNPKTEDIIEYIIR